MKRLWLEITEQCIAVMNSYRLNNNSLLIEGVNGCVLQALGNLYFIHESLEDVSIWDFVGEYL